VLGVEFEYNILATISKLDEEELVTILDELIRYKLLIELPTTFGKPIRYRFAHNNICEVLENCSFLGSFLNLNQHFPVS